MVLSRPQAGTNRFRDGCTLTGRFGSLFALAIFGFPQQSIAENLPQALVLAYQGHAQLNAERARQRATDEGLPQALAAYRPQLNASLSAGLLGVRSLLPDGEVQSATLRAWSAGVTASQTLFNGFRTGNSVRQAESQVFAGRETLR